MKSLRALLLAFGLITALTTGAQAQSAKWEYLVVGAALKTRALQQMLEARGAEGWELVAFTRKDVAVFKRKSR